MFRNLRLAISNSRTIQISSVKMTLEKQLEEIDVIQSMFPLEGEVEMDGDARQRLEDAIELDSETKVEIRICIQVRRFFSVKLLKC